MGCAGCVSARPAELHRQSLVHHVRVLLLVQVSLICSVLLLGSTSIYPCKHIGELIGTAEAVRVRLLEHNRSAVTIVGLLG